MAVSYVGSALLGGLVLDRMSGDFVPGLTVGAFVGSALTPCAFRLVMVSLSKDDVGSVKRLWQEAGIESPAGVTMAAAEARTLIEAPGTTSGVETKAERA
ncbi:hypothetical protein [Aeromicrobium sp. CF3.5]|uniref:hypothetical protein n=1 Tax=Aeromicrobium sp. CF3.5 TaxID=3373078 RepID=UPI003EE570B9